MGTGAEGSLMARGARLALWLSVPILAVAFFIWSEWLWRLATDGYRDGAWACAVITALAENEDAIRPMVGVRGMLLYASIASAFLLSAVALGVYSTWILIRIFERHSGKVAVASIACTAALLMYALYIELPRYEPLMHANLEDGCEFDVLDVRFGFEPYRNAIFEQLDGEASSLELATLLSRAVWAALVSVRVIAFIAVLALPLLLLPHGSDSIAALAERMRMFRTLLLLYSAMFTLINVYHLSSLGWLADVAAVAGADAVIREFQLGVTLYFGITNSLVLIILFAPIGVVLAGDARRLASARNPELTASALTRWEEENDLTVLGNGPIVQLLAFVAPFVVGTSFALAEKALLGAS